MKHASFFTGVGGLDLGFERAGIETVSVSEIEPYACAVLAERFPDAPNLGDIERVAADDVPAADVWSGGFPCQDLSVAGARRGFAGDRSVLAFRFLDLVEQRRPRWFVLENVLGLLSSNEGRDFARLIDEVERCGYGVAWRVLDAQRFGVPQRRRRVFVVASLGSDRAGEVLFECEGCERHPAPSRGAQQDAARIVECSTDGDRQRRGERQDRAAVDAHGVRETDGLAGRLDDQQQVDTFGATIHRPLQARDEKHGVSNQDIAAASRGEGFLIGYQTRADDKAGNFTIKETEVANALGALWPGDTTQRSMTLVEAVIQDAREIAHKSQNGRGYSQNDLGYTLTSTDSQAVVYERNNRDGRMREVRVSPTLQAGADNATDLPHVLTSGGSAEDELLPAGLDAHRYRCCGNGVASPVAEWIGRRLLHVDKAWKESEG